MRFVTGSMLCFLLCSWLLPANLVMGQDMDPNALYLRKDARSERGAAVYPERDNDLSYAAGNLLKFAEIPDADSGADPFPIDCAISPFGATYDSDLEAGAEVLHVLDISEGVWIFTLDLEDVDDIAPPVADSTFVGLTYNPDEVSLFWLEDTILHQTDGGGDIDETWDTDAFLEGFTSTIRGADDVTLFSGLTYVEDTESFWTYDGVSRTYYEFEITGTGDIVWGDFFLHPTAREEYVLGRDLGLGIASVDGKAVFDIPYGRQQPGFSLSPWIDRVARIDASGSFADTTNTSQALFLDEEDDLLYIDRGLGANVWHPTGSGDTEVNYIAGDEFNLVYEIDMSLDAFECDIAPLKNFTCRWPLDDDLDLITDATLVLNWDNGEEYDSIELYIDGELSDLDFDPDLGEGAVEVEIDPDAGYTEIQLVYTVDDVSCSSAICKAYTYGEGAGDGEFSAFVGGNLLDIAISESEDLIYAPDLLPGNGCYILTKELELDDVISPPVADGAAGLITGIACDNDTDELWWIYDDVPNPIDDPTSPEVEIILTDLDGVVVEDFEIDALEETGLLAGLCMTVNDSATGTSGSNLIINDIVNDEIFEIDTDDELEIPGSVFDAPRGSLYGNSVSLLPSGDGYEVPIGLGTDGMTTMLVQVDADGLETGCQTEVGPGTFFDDTFIQGSDFTIDGPEADDDDIYRYVVGNAGGLIFMAPYECETFSVFTPDDFECLFTDNTVELSWTNPVFYESLAIYRNGELLESLDDAESEEFLDDDLDEYGETIYELIAEDADGNFASATCIVSTFPSSTTTLVLNRETLGGLDSAETIMETLEALEIEAVMVETLENVDLTELDMIFVCLGTWPYAATLPLDEADALESWLFLGDGQGLYIEGSSHFSVAGDELSDIDGATFDETGERLCDVSTLEGADSGLTDGPDLSKFTGTYDCEGGFVDRISPTDEDADVVILSDGGDAGYMIYHDGDIADDFNYRVISSSLEFAGLTSDEEERSELLCTFITALAGGMAPAGCDDDGGGGDDEPTFLRGDADNNGDVSALLDSLFVLIYGFQAGDEPECWDATDFNGNGSFSPLTDSLYLLQFGFAGGDAPPDPGTDKCGPDPDPDDNELDCETPSDFCSD